MAVFALASEYLRLAKADRDAVTHLIPDDGTWTAEQVRAHVQGIDARQTADEHHNDWSRP